jgi:hypothetical protein
MTDEDCDLVVVLLILGVLSTVSARLHSDLQDFVSNFLSKKKKKTKNNLV